MEIIIIAILVTLLIYSHKKTAKPSSSPKPTPIPKEQIIENDLPIAGHYKSKWLFSYNEKDAFRKLQTIANKYDLTLLAKVRLFDLAEPIRNNPKYKTYLYKIQAKHVDFVLCNKKLVAKCVIELDDSSHDIPDRKKRDEFVDAVLTSVGYKILHVSAINIESLEPKIAEIFYLPNK